MHNLQSRPRAAASQLHKERGGNMSKATETRKANKAARIEKERARQEEKKVIKTALLQVLKDEKATSAEKVEAAKLLLEADK